MHRLPAKAFSYHKRTSRSKAHRCLILCFLFLAPSFSFARQPQQPASAPASPQKVIIDTDIGDDIDDAFAIGLALRSPELQILGITATFGDTTERAKLLDRFLAEVGRSDIPVAAGKPTPPKTPFTQRPYADSGRFSKPSHLDAATFILDQIHRYPGQITLIAIGPLMNVGAIIKKDPNTFRQLKRVVMMGGSIDRGYDDLPYLPPHGPDAEWNIVNDVPSAQKLFDAGVPIYMMPLDATQLKLDEVKRAVLFKQGTPVTDQLALLYHQWGQQTPTLYDPMTIAFILSPGICPTKPLHIQVDRKGFTRSTPGASNAQVCLHSDVDSFFDLFMHRLIAPPAASTSH